MSRAFYEVIEGKGDRKRLERRNAGRKEKIPTHAAHKWGTGRCSASEPSNRSFPLVFHRFRGYFFHSPCNALSVPSTTLTAMQGWTCFVPSSPQTPSYSRRHTSRVQAPDDVWVCWRCNGMDDVSRVRDLSVGGLFIATPGPRPVGMKAKLDFLVQEGQIRAEAIVRHIEPGDGLGLKFTAVTEQDSPHLAELLTRLRNLSRSCGKP